MAKYFFCILTAKNEFRPETTASLKAVAIKTGFFALAIALLIKTPSQPISIAIVASEAVPVPASILTGTFDCLIIKEIFTLLCIPHPDPIGEANGMMAEAPRSSNFFASNGSSVQYTITLKPSLTKVFVEFKVSTIFGYKVFLSPNTSNFTSFQPPISLANLRVLKASSEVKHPAVLGK